MQAINLAANIFKEAKERGYTSEAPATSAAGFPRRTTAESKPFRELAKQINAELDRLFPKNIEILAEPGRFLVATAATLVARSHRQGRSATANAATTSMTACTTRFHGIIFDHCQYRIKAFKNGSNADLLPSSARPATRLDTISLAEELPDLKLGDLVYSENIGAYSHASSTFFNGFPPAKVVHINQ